MSARKDRTGETTIANNGMKMTIIVYRNSHDMDVQFEDGAVRNKVQYNAFKIGNISHPNELRTNFNNTRIGDISVATNGMKMTIIAYRNSRDIDVQFDDGAVKKGVTYLNFIKGKISHPSEKDRTGETTIANNGMKMTIIAYRNSRDIDVQFDDGAVRKGVQYAAFKIGNIRHPKEQERKANLSKARLGNTSIASNGMTMTIVEYNDSTNIIVEFNDECHTRVKTSYSLFKKGYVKNPHFPMHGKGTYKTFETQYAYTAPDGSVYFYCECQKCGWKKNLTARELINLNHTCENIEGSETKCPQEKTERVKPQ